MKVMSIFKPRAFVKQLDFVLADNAVINAEEIQWIDISEIENQKIVVIMNDDSSIEVTGFAAMEMVWRLKPSALEGKRIKWHKRAWAIHNLIAHPLMQLLAFVGLYKQAMWIHDVTVPKPRNDNVQ